MIIRQLRDSDWKTFMTWMYELAEKSFGKVIPQMLEEEIKRDYQKEPEGFIVSEENGQLTGVIWFTTSPEKKMAFIHAIYITPKYRGTGLSDKLLDYLESYCASKSIKAIDLNVTTTLTEAIRFYKRKGFEVTRYSMSKKLKSKNENN
jgi:ribosomal protein S18 acetylase RimI-like enzyme